MEIYGWGCYPKIDSEVRAPQTIFEFREAVTQPGGLIVRGLGRSYGDSSIGEKTLEIRSLDRLIAFNEDTGELICDAGIDLAGILEVFVPKGWFLPVTPGTRFVTVGGAIASDVHGKNHHLDGTFCQHVLDLSLMLGSGELMTVSPYVNADLFYATCGGMGLTGIIVSARIKLRRIRSSCIVETTIKAPDLDAVLDAFEQNKSASYSVAWIDCLANGKNLGRSLLKLGEHADYGGLALPKGKTLSLPINLPNGVLNQCSVRAFNTIYYQRIRKKIHTHTVRYEPFFYPLDKLAHWNRLYGRDGFVQYQFVLPQAAGPLGLRVILERIAASGLGSFLAVLKVLGQENQNLLSFPMEGYTLALDFKLEPRVLALLEELDKFVLDFGGRLYLTKDARMAESTFKATYPSWEAFEEIRGRYHAIGKFASKQSQRLGLQ